MVGEQLAIKAGEKAAEAALGDLIVIEGNVFREVKKGRKKVLVPVNVRVSINPLTALIGLGAGLLGGAVGLWALGLGVEVLGADERQQLEMELASKEGTLANLEEDLARRDAANECIFEEVVAMQTIRMDLCEEDRKAIADFKAQIMKLKARLRVPVRIVNRDRFKITIPGLFP